jgi:hypothetical protein
VRLEAAPRWMERAACAKASVDPGLFFRAEGTEAASVCARTARWLRSAGPLWTRLSGSFRRVLGRRLSGGDAQRAAPDRPPTRVVGQGGTAQGERPDARSRAEPAMRQAPPISVSGGTWASSPLLNSTRGGRAVDSLPSHAPVVPEESLAEQAAEGTRLPPWERGVGLDVRGLVVRRSSNLPS